MATTAPRFSLRAGSLSADSRAPVSAPLRFVVERSLAVPIDCLRVDLGAGGGAAVGDAVTLDLGVGDAGLARVFTGSVAELRPRLGGCGIFCVGTMLALVDLRVASFYQETSAGDVVRDLLGQAALDAGDISNGLTLPRYAVERRVGAHAQLRRLAERLGFSLFADRQGKVHFKGLGAAASLGSGGPGAVGAASSLVGGATTTLEYGKHLLAAEAALRPALARTIVVGGESPMSGQGDDKSFWLTAKDSDYEGSSGSGDDWLITDTTARTKDMAGRFAAGYAASFGRRTMAVRASVLGNAALELGDAWGLSGAPEDGLNRSGTVAGLRHRFGAREGFVTDLVLAVEASAS